MQIGISKVSAIISPNFILPSEFSHLEHYKKEFNLKFGAMELRRMLNALKCALNIVDSLNIDKEILQNIPIVFSSFSGESNHCVKLLKNLKEDFVSPTAFSLSVLNATPAQMAIFYKNQNEISSISSKNSLEYGLINAIIKPDKKVLLINYEEISNDFENFSYYALGMLLDKEYKKCVCTLNFSSQEPKDNHIYQSPFLLLSNLIDVKNHSWSVDSNLKWNWTISCADS
ncbi:beta-ketoacyl synthase chain length factor [Helicobacter sp. MIT 99-5507]|uniref:beta-ketoacyl synthase chain length factor n=1 Tax=Helicobacter sp. MIT 99-5507 TaxID=152489 RepID=UPI000E1EE855|nr:beta-ketoacyl synthase chain length factor [Helicobacter sp. MIT 99-5507]RDU56718.1 hypothetical protein CQA42_07885 [Helicobacter sp. MIT 99-5507]